MCVAPRQGEVRSRIVVERGRYPALNIMAVCAAGPAVLCGKLAAVRVHVTIVTFLRSPLELHLGGAGCGLVARGTGHRTVRPEERKLGFGMVEVIHLRPGSNVVAGFASQRSAVGAALRHSVFELTMVRIRVACGATPIVKMVRHDVVGAMGRAGFVAIVTRDGGVCAGQTKARVTVLGNRKGRAMKVLHGVAALAAVPVGCRSKLTVVSVFVTVGA